MHQPKRIGLFRLVEHFGGKEGVARGLMSEINYQVELARARNLATVQPPGFHVLIDHLDVSG